MGVEEANFVKMVLARAALVVTEFQAEHLVSLIPIPPGPHIFRNCIVRLRFLAVDGLYVVI
jgi:hypothetical protein